MFKRMSSMIVLALLVASMLAACGGGAPAPVAFSSLPVFSGATESTNELLTGLLQPMIEGSKAESTVKNVDGKAYDVPEGTTVDAVKSFYKSALEKGGWKEGQATEDGGVFVRGNQNLVIKYAEGVGLITVLIEAK